MKQAMRTVGVGLGGITASLLLITAVWFHFLYTSEDPRIITIFENGNGTFAPTDYAEAIGMTSLFSSTDPHGWLLGALCLAIVAFVGWVIGHLTITHRAEHADADPLIPYYNW